MNEPLALVTGAGRGIGRAVVEQLIELGYRVVATGRDRESLDSLAREIDSSLVETGLIDLDSATLEADTHNLLGPRALDLLVLNAARFSPWDESPTSAEIDEARQVIETNLFGSWRLIQAALPALRSASAGSILAVGSGSGSHGDPDFGLSANPGAASYAVSKAALHALLHKLATELASENITVRVADPGLTATSPGMEAFGARPVEDGARSVLAPVRDALPTGTFSRDGAPLPW